MTEVLQLIVDLVEIDGVLVIQATGDAGSITRDDVRSMIESVRR